MCLVMESSANGARTRVAQSRRLTRCKMSSPGVGSTVAPAAARIFKARGVGNHARPRRPRARRSPFVRSRSSNTTSCAATRLPSSLGACACTIARKCCVGCQPRGASSSCSASRFSTHATGVLSLTMQVAGTGPWPEPRRPRHPRSAHPSLLVFAPCGSKARRGTRPASTGAATRGSRVQSPMRRR